MGRCKKRERTKEDKKYEGGKGDHSEKEKEKIYKGEEYLSKSEKNSDIR
jgi:hypothetical protein